MEKQKIQQNETDKKIGELKIEMLKQHQKRRSIKKEIARLLTMKKNQTKSDASSSKKEETTKMKNQSKPTKSGGNK